MAEEQNQVHGPFSCCRKRRGCPQIRREHDGSYVLNDHDQQGVGAVSLTRDEAEGLRDHLTRMLAEDLPAHAGPSQVQEGA